MNKTELIEAVAERAKVSKSTAEAVLKATVCAIEGALRKGQAVRLAGFGALVVRRRKARNGINPKTKKPIKIPASKTVAFRVSKSVRSKL